MSGKVLLSAVILCGLFAVAASAQPRDCEPCGRPGQMTTFSVMDVLTRDGSIIRGVRSAIRTKRWVLGRWDQAIRLSLDRSGHCIDTILAAEMVKSFFHEGIGGTGTPLVYEVCPAREIYSESDVDNRRNNFIELTGGIGYGGSDTSSRKIGFSSIYESIEAIVSPFGNLFGDKLALGIGGGLLFEGGRQRFPLFGHVRYSFLASEEVQTETSYYPDSCRFRISHEEPIDAPIEKFSEHPLSCADSTVFFVQQRKLIVPDISPFIYAEGGTAFDGSFEGSGTPENAVNPQDRKPLLLGLGIGTLIGENITISLGYRYMRLHLATPCPECVDRSIINTNKINSIMLRAGYRLPWSW